MSIPPLSFIEKISKINSMAVRRVYLMTYSKADRSKFKGRSDFGEVVTEAFNLGPGKVKVYYYATCLEQHQDGSEHFHTCVKLTGPKR